MPLTDNKITAFLKKVADLTDVPSENMPPAEIKAWLDSSPEELRVKLNALIDGLTSTTTDSGAKNIGVETINGLTGNDVQTLLQGLKTSLDSKTDLTGDFTGTWQGYSPSQADPGISSVVDSHTAQLADIVQVNAKSFGAKGDGITDNLTAFQSLSDFVNTMLIKNVEVFLPQGEYLYSGGLEFNRQCVLKGTSGTVLNYTGTGKAVKLGKDGITKTQGVDHYENHRNYEVHDLTFIGGLTMTHGLYFNDLVTMPRVANCKFIGFGNLNAWSVYFQSGNWDAVVKDCIFDLNVNGGVKVGGNGVYVNSYALDGTPDYGNSRLRMSDCLLRGGAANQTGIFINSYNNIVTNCKMEGLTPSIRVGGWGNDSKINNNYFEASGKAAIEIGSTIGRLDEARTPQNIEITNNYGNCHNSDQGTTTVFIAPTKTTDLLIGLKVENNDIADLANTREMVTQNNLSGQYNNVAFNNSGITLVHTVGANIAVWRAISGQGVLNIENSVDAAWTHTFKTGVTAEQSTNFQLVNYLNQQIANFNFNTSKFMSFTNNGVSAYQVAPTGSFQALVDSRSPKFVISSAQSVGSVVNGTIFEDSADGKLKYKNLAGVVTDLTL